MRKKILAQKYVSPLYNSLVNIIGIYDHIRTIHVEFELCHFFFRVT